MISLRHLADVRVSNVDKKSKNDEVPVRLVNYVDVYYGDRIVPEMRLMAATASRNQIKTFALNPGDVVITKDSESADDIGVPAFVERTESDMVCGYHLAILRPRLTTIEGRFLYWTMNSQDVRSQMESAATGITRFGLRTDAINQIKIRVPSHSMQRAIANHLDTETARIDTLISKKQRLIELLKDRIDSIVFDGIRGRLTSVESSVKSSGIEWLGNIPHHFETPWLGAYHTTELGKMLNTNTAAGPEQYPYIKNTNVKWDHFDLEDLPTMTFKADDRRRCELRPGDVVICEGGEVGRAAVWSHHSEIYFQKALHRVRPVTKNVPRFLMYCLWSAAKLNVFAIEGNQSTIVHLTGEKLREHRFPWPPLDEQTRIASLIDAERRRADQAINRLKRQVLLLSERKQALITSVVTGEVPV